jgi:fibronectin type 3 domain-containing protein
MKVLATLGTVMMVLGFLASAVGAFPLIDVAAANPITEETPFSVEVVDQTAAQIGTMYTTIVDDLMSFAENPDLALATERRDTMIAYAEDLSGRFQVFASDLQLDLDAITEAPLAPTGLTAVGGNGEVTLNWNDNVEPDFNFYNVYRSTTAGGPYSFYAAGITQSTFVDGGVANGTTTYYVVTAINDGMVESDESNEASATPQG